MPVLSPEVPVPLLSLPSGCTPRVLDQAGHHGPHRGPSSLLILPSQTSSWCQLGQHTHAHSHTHACAHVRAPKFSLSEDPQSRNQGSEQKHFPKAPTVCKVVMPSGGCDCILSSGTSLTTTHLSDFASLGRRKELISYKAGGAGPSSPAGQEGSEV